tara:strand:- start:1110 stop:1745 length:636 start_codon:yes stop_codon:yes gene_type:complete
MIFPITVIDNFFSDPDAIVEIASGLEYFSSDDGRWPGQRTRSFYEIDNKLYSFLVEKLFSIWYETMPSFIQMDMHFQIINPFSEDKWDKMNRGWIHLDDSLFGGIIYLTKDPDPDTGTSIYKPKRGFAYVDNTEKVNLHTSNIKHPGIYSNGFDDMFDQYEETINVSNVYNRLLLFDGKTAHGVRTFGTKSRLTLPFIAHSCSSIPPLFRK